MSEDVRGSRVAPAGGVTARGLARARLAWISRPRTPGNPSLDQLVADVRKTYPRVDSSVIERAYAVAERAHEGQMRKSGDPYITHPLAVAAILAELGMPPATIAAALLHDVVEDTDYPLADIEEEFGKEIARLVDGVTKLDKVTYGEAAQAETVRKMIVAMSGDIRVLVIKLADRLHNARTWQYVSREGAQRKAAQTLDIYAPLAHRLGMNTIKWELEDLAFKTLLPKIFAEIERQVADGRDDRLTYLANVQTQIQEDLAEARINATVTGRPKHYYSVYQKMLAGQRTMSDIHDLVALRVLVESTRDCYAALGALHARWTPIAGRFKDYIAMPKFNMYQSLHTTVIGPGGKPVEIQIRTEAMHRRADYGVAAHWKYKEDRNNPRLSQGVKEGETGPIVDMAWMRQLLDWQQETKDPSEFLDGLRYEVNAREVYVFTPKGEVVALPSGSCPVDFAYTVHTEVGHRCVGARVNGRLVPLESPLENGDVVDILTSKAAGAGPSRDWQAFVQSPRARSKIKHWFSKERREEMIEAGKEAIAKALRKQHLPLQRMMTAQSLTALANELRFPDIESLYAAVGEGHMSAQNVVARLVASFGGEAGASEDLAESVSPNRVFRARSSDPGVVVKGMPDVWIKLARCCTPVPGDEIMGYVTKGSGVSVHRLDCTNVHAMQTTEPLRVLDVVWAPGPGSLFLVNLRVEALDRHRLLADITRVLSDNGVNILNVSLEMQKNRVAVFAFRFEMGDPTHLDYLMKAVHNVRGVIEVDRGASRRTPGLANRD